MSQTQPPSAILQNPPMPEPPVRTTPDGFLGRKDIYEKIEAERGSKVLLYITGDRPEMETQIGPDVVDLFVDHLDELWPAKKLSLILYTQGGNTSAAWRLINLLRTFCDELEIIVISKAHSAGTLMCLGANQIVMTKQATLGPIDPSLNGPLNPQIPGAQPNHRAPVSVEAVQGFLDVAQEQLKIEDASSLTQVLTNLSSQIHPLVLGQIFRTRTQIRALANKLLSYQKIDSDKKEGIISFLCSDSGSHDHTINRREARELGLVVENPSADFYAILKELCQSVTETLRLRSRFSPDTELAADQHIRYICRRGLIESRVHGSHQFISEGHLMRMNIQPPNGLPQIGIQDNRTFDGWRKEA